MWGPNLDPDALTDATKVPATKSFHVGERPGNAAHLVAGWEWWSDWGDSDADSLFAELLRVLQPNEACFREAASNGADVSLSVVGEVYADLISTEAEADAKGWYGGEGKWFRPFLATDRPVIFLDQELLNFLTATHCTFATHLDFALDNETK